LIDAAEKQEVRSVDFVLLGLALALTTVGIMLVFDASYPFALAHRISLSKYVGLQSLWGVFGISALLAASYIPYWTLRKVATIGLLGCMIALVFVFVPHIGIHAKGAYRWIGHGSYRIQPSEFAKLFIVLFIARSCAGSIRIMKNFLTGPGPSVCAATILVLLIVKEPDLGTALLIALTALATLFFAGMKVRHLAVVVACGVILGGAAFTLKSTFTKDGSYQLKRIMVFLNPEKEKQGDGFQVYHSILALGTGGVTGMGLGQGRQKLDLPEAYTDFIFAVVGEEGGLMATLTVLTLLALTAARGMHIACNTRDRFGSLAAAGISFCLGFQALVNVGVVTASIPATGVPLPFISYGGTSLLLSLIMVGILLNINKYPDGDPKTLRHVGELKSERDYNRRWHMSGGDADAYASKSHRSSGKPAAG
jgi:cell division protein FtsW